MVLPLGLGLQPRVGLDGERRDHGLGGGEGGQAAQVGGVEERLVGGAVFKPVLDHFVRPCETSVDSFKSFKTMLTLLDFASPQT